MGSHDGREYSLDTLTIFQTKVQQNYATTDMPNPSGGVRLYPSDDTFISDGSSRSGGTFPGTRQAPKGKATAGSAAAAAAAAEPGEVLSRKNLAKLSISRGSVVSASSSQPDKDGAQSSVASEELEPGRFFQAYDPTGRAHKQRVSSQMSEAGSDSSSVLIETQHDGAMRPARDERNRSGFARVRPRNQAIRRFVGDERPEYPPTPGRTRIGTHVMEDEDSDDD